MASIKIGRKLSRKSPTLPEIPDIIHGTVSATPTFTPTCEGNKKLFFDHQQQLDSCTNVRILSGNRKSYGTTRELEAKFVNRSLEWARRRRERAENRKYSASRIHRTSSLNRFDDYFCTIDPSYGDDDARLPTGDDDDGDLDGDPEGGKSIAISDIIGSFGPFQLLVLLFSGLREGLVGYDALIMSVILQPESKFLCADNLPRNFRLANNTTTHDMFERALEYENELYDRNLTFSLEDQSQCFRSLDGGRIKLISSDTHQPLACESWLFANETQLNGPSLVAEWSLVCQYQWLVAFIESAYFFGLVAGNLTWGYYADKLGRRPAYLAAHTISLVFGGLAICMSNVYLFALCRFLAAFGSIGYNIIYSIQVELIGLKHRSFSTTLNHLGWGLGVICIPLVDHLFNDYRPIIALAPVLSLLMYPWAFWLPESPRWLMANGHFERARRELKRAAEFNGRQLTGQVEKDLWALEQRIKAIRMAQSVKRNSGVGGGAGVEKRSYRLIFTTPTLARDTLILSYSAFVGHLFYYVQTINFAYMKNLSTEANFISSGAGEWLSVAIGAILLKAFTRRACMSLFLFLLAASFAFQSLIDSAWLPQLDTTLIITTNNTIGTLSALLLVFVVLIVNQEVYPTVVRQTGTSITNTLGESGSTLAPLVIQFARIVGPARANAIYTIFCSLAILAVQFVTRTDDIELPDT